jgi:hypothetical protein
VLEAGARAASRAEFAYTYSWLGKRLPAAGVPVAFELTGGGGIVTADAETDRAGLAGATLDTAYGPAGRRDLSASVDLGAVRAATGGRFGRVGGSAHGTVAPDAGGEASQAVYVVEGGHGISVCTEFRASDPGDALQAETGFGRRMERDGYRMVECGAEVDVVVRGEVSLTSEVADGAWSAEAALAASGFDQRVARDVGETIIRVTETSDEGAREAEVLALKEAGRLLAAYLTRRILMHGE